MCLMSVLNKQKTLKIQYLLMTMCKCNTWGFSHEWSDYVKQSNVWVKYCKVKLYEVKLCEVN